MALPLLGAAIGGAGALASAFGAKSAAKKQMSELKKLLQMGQAQAGYAKLIQGNILEYQKKTLLGGFEKASNLLAGGKFNAKAQAKAIGIAQQGEAKASLAAKGLYNTTVFDSVSAGISANLAMELGQIDATYDNMLGELELGKTEGLLGIADKEMGLEQWYAGAMMGGFDQMFGAVEGGNVGGFQFDMGGFGELWGQLFEGDPLSSLFGGGGLAYPNVTPIQ